MKISDLLDKTIDNRGKTPPVVNEGYPLLEINCIAGKDKFPDYSLIKKYVSSETYRSWFRSGHPKRGDILIPTVGTLDAISVMDRDDCCIAQNLVAFRCNPNICDNEFLYYLLCDPTVRLRVLQLDIGAVQPSIKVPHLKGLEVEIPPLTIQKKIACILNTLDSKIYLNKKINENLLQQAGAIFNKFYDESSNQQPFTSLIDVLGGGTPKTGNPDFWDGPIPFFTPKDVGTPYTFQTEKYITESGLTHCNSRLYQKDTTFVTARGTVGKVSLAGTPMAMNQSCYALASETVDPLLVYFYVLKAVASLKNKASGAVFDAIVTRDFDGETINVLSDDDAKYELAIIKPMMEAIHNNIEENIRLVALRDSLLPRLMSGELDVSELDI